jgi:DNA-directed RNA polymerase specialized sigma24 family protein
VSNRETSRADFEEFVASCSPRLLRTAYLLVGDRDVAEQLLQDGLARTWLSWRRLEQQPESHVRRLLVRAALRRQQPAVGSGDGLADRLGRLSRRQRAVVVLRYLDDLPEATTAEMLGCSETVVRSQAARALAALGVDPTPAGRPGHAHGGGGVRTDELSAALLDLADEGMAGGPTPADRLAGVDARVEGLRRWRTARRTVATGVVAAAALSALVLVPRPAQPHGGTGNEKPNLDRPAPLVDQPPTLVGFQLPVLMRVNDVPYQYLRSEQSAMGEDRLRVAIGPARQPQALAWATPSNQPGRVLVTVDGNTVSRDKAGGLASSVLLSPRNTHLVVLRVTQPMTTTSIGLAIYQWPRSGMG